MELCQRQCFVAGTPVQVFKSNSSAATSSCSTPGLVKPIEEVRVGDRVISRDPITGRVEPKRVVSTSVRNTPRVLEIGLAECKSHRQVDSLTVTREHPIYIEGRGFVPAGELKVGNKIKSRFGQVVAVSSIKWHQRAEPFKVYNFEVQDDHSYFVGTYGGGVWVHNYPKAPRYRRTFADANPGIDTSKLVVHHAIEQQVQDLYPGLFTYAEIHSADNLRGIPVSINNWAHLSVMRRAWDAFYASHPIATRQEVLDFAHAIDQEWGANMIPYK